MSSGQMVTVGAPALSLTERQRAILRVVLTAGPVTRADLAQRLQLSRSKLSPQISELLERGLLTVDGGNASGGRPSALLGMARSEAAVVVGVDINTDRVTVASAMLGGSILRRCAELLDARDPEAAIARAIELIGETLDASYGPLVAIGVSIAADIDPTAGVPIAAPTMPAWVGFPLGSRLARVYNTRIYVDNDVNALALREMIARRSNAPFLVVKISHGIGCGIVVDGSLFRGIEGSAGDIGHICLDPADETRCACGNRGCLEAVAATPAVIAKADTLARTGASAMLARFVAEHGSLTEDLVGQAASGGDEAAARLLKEQGRRIGYVLSGLVSFFNPSAVLIASGLGAGRAILLSAIRQAVYERALPAATRKLEIGEATLDEDDAVVGSAILGSYGYLGSSGSRALHHGLEPN